MKKRISAVVIGLLVMSLLTAAGHNNGDRNFKADLSGSAEVPAVATETTGKATFHVNRELTEIRFKLQIDNAEGILAAAGAHIHCGPAGANGPVAAFLAGAVPPSGLDGSIDIRATLTDASVLATDCGTTIAELVDAMRAGNTYVNVHSAANPGGEVRGQIG
jgi:hypothetical protein